MNKTLIILSLLFLSLPSHALQTLKNGAPFFSNQDADLPRNIFIISFLGGPSLLTPEHQGIIPILKEALKEGPSDLSENEYKDQLFSLGTDIDYIAKGKAFEVVVRVPPAQQTQALELLKRTLSKPRISQEYFERYKGNVLAATKSGFEDMRQVVFYFSLRDLFAYAPESMNGDTSPASLEKLTYENFTSNIEKLFNYQRMFVTYVGQEPGSDAQKKFEAAFSDRLKGKYLGWKPKQIKAPSFKGPRYTIINKPGATDNQLVFIFPQEVKRDSADWADASLVMDLLGGGLHGKLGHTLRTVRGLTYHAGSWMSLSNLPTWTTYTFGGIEQTKPLLEGVPEVIASFKKSKLNPTEVNEAKERLVNGYKTETELPIDSVREMAWFYANGYDPNHAKRFESDLQSANVKRVSRLKDKLNTTNASVYLMGDKENLLKALEATGVKRGTVKIVEPSEIK